MVTSAVVIPVGVPKMVAVPSPLSWKNNPFGKVPSNDRLAAGVPEVTTVKLLAEFVTKLALDGLENSGSDPTVMVNNCVVVPAAFVADTLR